jgi:hypothetical protein
MTWRALLLVVALPGISAGFQSGQETVRMFNLEKSTVNLENAKALGVLLVEFAQGQAVDSSDYHLTGPYRKLVRVAFQLAPDDPAVAAAHGRIREGLLPLEPKNKVDRAKVMPALAGLIADARQAPNQDDLLLAAFLSSAGLEINPDDEVCLKEAAKQGNMDAYWERALSVYVRNIPDGSVTVIKGLVVTSSGGAQAGKVARILLTYRAREANTLQARLLRELGSMMTTSADEAIRYWSRGRRGGPQATGTLEISFEDKFTQKEGPSAGAAYAVLLRSFSDPFSIDPAFAMTGDVSVEGRVLPVGGVYAKIRGAVMGGCTRVGIPAGSEADLSDSLVLNGPATLAEIEVVAMDTVDDAIALARVDRDEKGRKVSADFASLRALVDRKLKGGSDPAVTESIQKLTDSILAASPRHLSAKVIDQWNRNKLPGRLSLAASLDAAHDVLVGYLMVIRRGDRPAFADIEHETKTATVASAVDKLKALLPKLHFDAQKPGDKLEQCCTSIQRFIYLRADLDKKRKKIDDLQKTIKDLQSRIDRARAERRPVDEINALVKRHNQAVMDQREAMDDYNKDADARREFLRKAMEHYNDFVSQVRSLVQDPKLLEKLLHGK